MCFQMAYLDFQSEITQGKYFAGLEEIEWSSKW